MRSLLINLLRRFWMPVERAPQGRVPAGCRVYAVGDIHGRSDLLAALHGKILADAASVDPCERNILIYIGDYVDRGTDSRGVLDALLAPPPTGFERVTLLGNHDAAFLNFLSDASHGPKWFRFGGRETVASYGVGLGALTKSGSSYESLRQELAERVPHAHRAFLSGLRLHYEIGDYLFVHAGLRPGRPLAEQVPEDLLSIRNRFLLSRRWHGKIVVHGHSRSPALDFRPNRIGIDTGAYATGRLTCLVLEGMGQRTIATAPP